MNSIILLCNINNYLNSDPVSGEELGKRATKAMAEISNIFKIPVVYLIVICLIISVIMIITGNLAKSSTIKKSGVTVFLGVCAGAVLFFCIPLVIGLLKNISNIFNGG